MQRQDIWASFVRQWGPWAACDKRDEVRVVQLTIVSLGIHVWILALTWDPSVTGERSHTLRPNLKGKRSSEPPHCSEKECSFHIKMIVIWRKEARNPWPFTVLGPGAFISQNPYLFQNQQHLGPDSTYTCQPYPNFWIRNCGCWDIQAIGYTPDLKIIVQEWLKVK